jgi:protein-S-isoprenylcysteine O-methyltransferase Ste14
MIVIEPTLNLVIVLAGLIVATGVFAALFFVNAPYGRHFRQGWGPLIASTYGWLIMETPAALVFAARFVTATVPRTLPIWLFFAMWELHYVHRAFIYPLTLRGGQKQMPVTVIALAFGFNVGNAYVNGGYLFHLSGGYPPNWIGDPRFVVGLTLFLAGYGVNRWADLTLRGLRRPGETGYKIPHGGLFRQVSCPNYLGEIVEWFGWALATWSLPGLAFALWSVANLAPRARAHHAWYHDHFPDYPPERKALIPWIW